MLSRQRRRNSATSDSLKGSDLGTEEQMEDQNGFDVRREPSRQNALRRPNRYRESVLIVLACAYWGLARQGGAQELLEPTRAAAHEFHSWRPVGMGGGGAMFTPAISPADPARVLLSCDMSGVYRSADGGTSWEMIHYQDRIHRHRLRPLHRRRQDLVLEDGASAAQHDLRARVRSGDAGHNLGGVLRPARYSLCQRHLGATLSRASFRWHRAQHRFRRDVARQLAGPRQEADHFRGP
jgi:hypothetical protein